MSTRRDKLQFACWVAAVVIALAAVFLACCGGLQWLTLHLMESYGITSTRNPAPSTQHPAPSTRSYAMPAFNPDSVPASAQAELVKIYEDAGKRIAATVMNPTGKTFDARGFTRSRAAALLAQVQATLGRTEAQTGQWVGKWVPYAYRKGLRDAIDQLKAAGVRKDDIPVTGDFSRVDERTVGVFAADIAAQLQAALNDQGEAATRFLRSSQQTIIDDVEISRTIAQAAVDGDWRSAVRELRGKLNVGQIEDYRKAGSQIISVGKAQMTVRSYAEMLVRTRLREATCRARNERLVANGRDLVTIVGRISANFCTEYVGRVFSITGATAEYPALSELPGGGPPFHPNCSKSTVVYIPEFATPAQERNARGLGDSFRTTDPAAAQRAFTGGQGRERARKRLDALGVAA